MTEEPIDILVLTYNRIEYIKTFIEFLYLFTDYPFRLIVVDNGSTDGTRELILEFEKVGLIHNHLFTESNIPLAAAFTEALPLVESELFVTVADDMLAPRWKNPCWLTVFVTKIKSDEDIGCVNAVGARCSLRSFNNRTRPIIYDRIKAEGGKRLKMFKYLQKLIYKQ